MNFYSDIQLEAADLELGENTRVLCPACRGGQSQELSLSITLGEDSVLRWQCFRSKCDLGAGTNAQSRAAIHTSPLVKPRKKFEGKVTELDPYYIEWIMKNWGIEGPEHWWYTPEMGGRIAMSVRSPTYVHRGWVLRDIMGQARTKALTYIDNDEEGLSWYKTNLTAPTVVVEDIPSAVRVQQCGANAVALLGTHMGLNRAMEIANNAPQGVVVALDNDALELSFRHAKRYGLIWGSVSVLPLANDFKDMQDKDIKELLNERETCTIGGDA